MSNYSNHNGRNDYSHRAPQPHGQSHGVQGVRTIHSAPLEDADPMGGHGGPGAWASMTSRHPFEGQGQRLVDRHPFEGRGQRVGDWDPSGDGESSRYPSQGGGFDGRGQRMSSHHPSEGGRHHSQRMPFHHSPHPRHSSHGMPSRHSSHVGDHMPQPHRPRHSHSHLPRDPNTMTIGEYFQAEAAGLIPQVYDNDDAPRQSRHGHHGGHSGGGGQRHTSHHGGHMYPPTRSRHSHSNFSRDPSTMTMGEFFQAEAAGLIPPGYDEDAPRQSRHGHHGGYGGRRDSGGGRYGGYHDGGW